MKVTRTWLQQYVAFDWSAAELAERLTLLGLEVEGVETRAGEFEGIVVAQVLSRDPHPNADKLSVCRVHDGEGERRIVCGASNFQAGDKVPMIRPGASLPARPGEPPFTIKVGKIRGVESAGMLCSPQELGLAEEAAGLLILRPDAPVGQPLAEYLGRRGGAVVLDLEITPNRPDLNSVLGIAREIAAVTGNPLRLPALPDFVSAAPSTGGEQRIEDLVAVRLDEATLCPRYIARVVCGVKVGPSPDWLRQALEEVGQRSINNVVDVTNYVMLECGQPLHAFDYHLLGRDAAGRPTIVVRGAAPGETFVTLDGRSHQLTPEMLLIADPEKGIALAGVMGGQNSEIHEHTVDVLIESAWFQPTNIRRTSKALGLRTDASYRFERGVDLGLTDWASRRCAQLLLETAGGRLAAGVVDAFPAPPAPHQITLRHRKVNELLGTTLPPEQIEYHLGQLGLKVVGRKATPVEGAAPVEREPVTFRIPSWRPDLKREADLIEEVCRLHGVDQIAATPPRGCSGANEYDAIHDQLAEARRLLAGLGLDEAQGQTLISGAVVDGAAEASVRLANPLSSDMDTLRPSLLPGLLDALRHNLNHKNGDVALFEIGRVFARGTEAPREQRRLALALTGLRYPPFWSGADRQAKFDLFDLKGVLEEFLEQFGLRGVTYARREGPTSFWIESATVSLGGRVPLGELGQLLPSRARQYDLRDTVWLAELEWDQLLARRNVTRSLKPLPQFPSVRRDAALILPEPVTHEAVLAVVKQARAPHLERVDLFDVFRGSHVPAGRKSVAYAFTYRAPDRTLTDAEVNGTQEQLVRRLESQLAATVRDA
jgi:phenylalanyl-tRNA synthetase beta chain